MKRKTVKRINAPGDAHCLTFSCYHRLPLLRSETLCRWLAEAIGRAREDEAFDLWGYVFKPEHVHLLVYPREREYSLSRILTATKRPVAWQAIKHLRASADPLLESLRGRDRSRAQFRLWQTGGGHGRNLQSTPAIHAMLDYIHYNPVARGLVGREHEWKWSSAGDWEGLLDQPLRIDRTLPPLMP